MKYLYLKPGCYCAVGKLIKFGSTSFIRNVLQDISNENVAVTPFSPTLCGLFGSDLSMGRGGVSKMSPS